MSVESKGSEQNFSTIVNPPFREARAAVLSVLCNTIVFTPRDGFSAFLKDIVYPKIAEKTNYHIQLIETIVKGFLHNLKNFKSFIKKNPIKWSPDLTKLEKKVRIYLHKLYRLTGEVFNFKKSKRNLHILYKKLEFLNSWPQISTQLAFVIYITNKNSSGADEDKRMLQKNIRELCNCSAFAFHSLRNKLGLKD